MGIQNNAAWQRNAFLFLAGQTITLFGSALVQYAINWHITLTTKSGTIMTISIICAFLPQLIISLFSGVIADRFDRRKIIIFADIMIAFFTALLAILISFGQTGLWLLFVISAIRSLGTGIQTPAVSAFLPEIVPPDKLMRVNGINASLQSVIMLLAPAAAGGLYAAMGLSPIFWVDVVTALAGTFMLLILKAPKREIPPAHELPHFFADMSAGFKYLIKTKWLFQFLLFYVFIALLFGPVVFLTPLMVARSFGEEPWRLVVHEMVFSAGSILGGILVGVFSKKIKNQVRMVILACVAFGFTTFLMGFSPNFLFYLGVMLPMGFSMPFVNTGTTTLLQLRVPPDLLGRIFGLVGIVGSSAMPLSMLVFGPLADYMSIELQLIITGAAMVLISLSLFKFKDMIAAGEVDKMISDSAAAASPE